MKDRIKDFLPTGAGIFTIWITNRQVEAFYEKLQEVCYKTDPNNVYGDCNFDTTMLFFTCVLAGIGVGVMTHYFVVKEHK